MLQRPFSSPPPTPPQHRYTRHTHAPTPQHPCMWRGGKGVFDGVSLSFFQGGVRPATLTHGSGVWPCFCSSLAPPPLGGASSAATVPAHDNLEATTPGRGRESQGERESQPPTHPSLPSHPASLSATLPSSPSPSLPPFPSSPSPSLAVVGELSQSSRL